MKRLLAVILAGAVCFPACADPVAADVGHAGQQAGWFARCMADTAVARWATDLRRRAAAKWHNAVETAHLRQARSLGVFVLDDSAGGTASWVRLEPGHDLPRRLVLLIHGLDEPGPIWDDAAPAIRSSGFPVARFEYPNDQSIARSADLLADWMCIMRAAGVERLDIVAHSMGGLVARDVLSRTAYYGGDATGGDSLPRVERLIMIGTPNHGAPLASLRPAAELREQVGRWLASGGQDATILLGFLADGDGEAGKDLAPGSPFLVDLNARPLPSGVRITIVEGRVGAASRGMICAALGRPELRRLLGEERADALESWTADRLLDLGDGVVPSASCRLDGVEDVVVLEADHRSMIRRLRLVERARSLTGRRRDAPPALAVVLDRLRSP